MIFDICYMMNQQYYIYSKTLRVLILACYIEFNYYKTRVYCITVFYNTLKLNHIILYHILISATWWTNRLYIFQNTPKLILACCIELITTRRELLHYSNLIQHKLNHIILYHIWYLLHDEPTVLYYFSILQVLISVCCMEFNHYKTWITALQ